MGLKESEARQVVLDVDSQQIRMSTPENEFPTRGPSDDDAEGIRSWGDPIGVAPDVVLRHEVKVPEEIRDPLHRSREEVDLDRSRPPSLKDSNAIGQSSSDSAELLHLRRMAKVHPRAVDREDELVDVVGRVFGRIQREADGRTAPVYRHIGGSPIGEELAQPSGSSSH